MLKKLIDTNIFIDRFSNPNLYKEIFLSEGLVYISAIVLMEIRAGAHTKEAIHAYNDRNMSMTLRHSLPAFSVFSPRSLV